MEIINDGGKDSKKYFNHYEKSLEFLDKNVTFYWNWNYHYTRMRIQLKDMVVKKYPVYPLIWKDGCGVPLVASNIVMQFAQEALLQSNIMTMVGKNIKNLRSSAENEAFRNHVPRKFQP